MIPKKLSIFYIVLFFILYSFTREISLNEGLSPQKYLAYVAQKESTISKQKVINSVKYELRYMPNDLLFLNYMKSTSFSKKDYTSFKNENVGTSTFQLRISTPENGMIEFLKYPVDNGKSYEERVKYYSFELQKEIKLTDEKGKEYACTGYIFERNYGIQPYGIIHLVFPIDVSKKQVTVSVNDNGIATNQVQFDYAKKDLQFPKMKYTKQ